MSRSRWWGWCWGPYNCAVFGSRVYFVLDFVWFPMAERPHQTWDSELPKGLCTGASQDVLIMEHISSTHGRQLFSKKDLTWMNQNCSVNRISLEYTGRGFTSKQHHCLELITDADTDWCLPFSVWAQGTVYGWWWSPWDSMCNFWPYHKTAVVPNVHHPSLTCEEYAFYRLAVRKTQGFIIQPL